MDSGGIKVSFKPSQRSLFLLPSAQEMQRKESSARRGFIKAPPNAIIFMSTYLVFENVNESGTHFTDLGRMES